MQLKLLSHKGTHRKLNNLNSDALFPNSPSFIIFRSIHQVLFFVFFYYSPFRVLHFPSITRSKWSPTIFEAHMAHVTPI